MGMFDYVDTKGLDLKCPKCNAEIKEFQSKDRECNMDTIHWSEADCFYSHCPKCEAWIEFVRTERDKLLPNQLQEYYKASCNGKPVTIEKNKLTQPTT